MLEIEILEKVVAAVRRGARYRDIDEGLVRRVAAAELAKGRRVKEAVKAARSKLHQVAGAYIEKQIGYTQLIEQLEGLPADQSDPDLQSFCRQAMQFHTSTLERLPILENFYSQTLLSIAPIRSVLDLACGLNPLALPWMPLSEDVEYHACDIYTDMVDFLQLFLEHLNINGNAFLCDLVETIPSNQVHLALLLKTIPCLEQLDKSIAPRLLDSIHAEHILVSFPVHSLGGRSKGMLENYEARFRQLLTGRSWQVQRYEFASELAFLISR